MLLSVFIFNYFIAFSDLIVIHLKGPHHKNVVVKCLEQISAHAYNFNKVNKKYQTDFLLTYLINQDLSMPGAEIQDEFLKRLHKSDKYTIEVLQYARTDFQSYSSNCLTDESSLEKHSHFSDCIRKHVKQMKTTVYVIVMDDVEMMKSKLEFIRETSSFNRDAFYIIYYSKIGNRNHLISRKIISYLYHMMVITKMVVMMPRNLTNFETYVLKIDNESGIRCFSKSAFKIQRSHQCIQGV